MIYMYRALISARAGPWRVSRAVCRTVRARPSRRTQAALPMQRAAMVAHRLVPDFATKIPAVLHRLGLSQVLCVYY